MGDPTTTNRGDDEISYDGTRVAFSKPEGDPLRVACCEHIEKTCADVAAEMYGSPVFTGEMPGLPVPGRKIVFSVIKRALRDHLRIMADRAGLTGDQRDDVNRHGTLGFLRFKVALRKAIEGAGGDAGQKAIATRATAILAGENPGLRLVSE